MVSPLSAGAVFVDVLPDTSRFGGTVRRELTSQTAGLKRQSEQLSRSFTQSFSKIADSVKSATSNVGHFGLVNEEVADSTQEVQQVVEQATLQREQASESLAQAEHDLAEVQSRSSASAEDLAAAQQRVKSASLDAAIANGKYDRSLKDLGASSEDTRRSFLTLVPAFSRIGESIKSATSNIDTFGSVNERVQQEVTQAQHAVERATIRSAQAQEDLARVQSRSSSSANQLAMAELRVKSASLNAVSANERYERSVKQLGDSGDDTRRSFSSLIPSIGQANSSLSLASRSAGMFGGAISLIKWPVMIQGANLAAAAISQISAAAVGAVASLAPLAGLVATIPAGIATIGSAVGAASLGFFGVGDALSAMGEQASASVPAVSGAGGAAQDAGRAAADAGRAVMDAQRGVADANRAVEDSERSLADAQRQVQFAQESLTQAREDARQTLRDLRDEIEGNALSEDQAKLRVLQARQRLREVQRDENATRLEVRQAALDVRQAEFDLQQTREDNREEQELLNKAERQGVEGSEQVIAARRGVADANRGVADAERALADAHRGVADAQRAVAEAQRGVTEALQAGSGATTAASAETTALVEAMAALSPAGRDFVRVLFDMKPKLDALRATAQQGLLPGLGRAIQTLGRELFPLLNRVVGKTARTMGDLAEEGADLVTSGPWKRDFATILSGNTRLLNNMGHIAFDLGDAFRHIAVAGQPLAFWLGRIAEKGAQTLADFFQKARRTGNMAEFFERTRQTAERLFSILGNLGEILVDVLAAGQPLGRWLLRQFDDLTEGWATFTGSMEGRNALKIWFDSAKPVLRELGRLIGDVAKLFGEMATTGGLPRLIRQVRTQLLPVFRDILQTSSGKLIPSIVELGRQFLKLFKVFGTEHGFVLSFVRGLTGILRAITKLIEVAPVLKGALSGLGSLASIFAAVKVAGFVTGLSSVAKALGGLRGNAATAGTKVGLLSRTLGRGGAATGGAAASGGLAGALGAIPGPVKAVALALGGLVFISQKMKTESARLEDVIITQGKATKLGAEAWNDYTNAQDKMPPSGAAAAGAMEQTRRKAAALLPLHAKYVRLVKDNVVGQKAFTAAIQNGMGVRDALAAAERRINRVEAVRARRIPDLIDLSERQGAATRQEKNQLGNLLRQLKLTGTELTSKEEAELGAAIAAGKHKEAVKLLNEMLGRTPRHVQIKIEANVSAAMEDFRAVVDSALEAGSAAAQGYSQAYKNALQMRSPSRVFIGIGKNVMAGLRIGLERNKPEWKNLMPKRQHFAEGKRGFEDFKRSTIRIWNIVRDKIIGVWRPIRNTVSNGVKVIAKWWRELGEDLRRLTRRAWEFVRDTVSDGIKKVREVVDDIMDSLRDQWDRNWDGVRDVVANVWDRIKNVISNAWDVVRRMFDNALDAIRRMWDNGWRRLNDVLHRVWGNIFDFIRKIPGKILDFFKNLPENLRKVGENAIGAFAAGIKSGDSIIASAIKAALGPLTGGLSNIIDLFGDAGKVTGDGLGDAAALSLGTGGGKAATWARKAAAAIPGSQSISGYRSPEENAAVGGAPNSYHMDINNPAQDISGSNLLAVAQWLVGHYGASAREIIHTPLGYSVINGVRVPPVAAADHYDHVHVADRGGVFRGPGLVQIGNIKETIFQPAERIRELPTGNVENNYITQLMPGMRDVIKRTAQSSGQEMGLSKIQDRFKQSTLEADDYKRALEGIPQRKPTNVVLNIQEALKGLADYIKRLKEVPTRISTMALANSGEFSVPRAAGEKPRRDHVRVADRGGVFKGSGMVGIGGIKETVFQPAEKIGDLPRQDKGLLSRLSEFIAVVVAEMGRLRDAANRATRLVSRRGAASETGAKATKGLASGMRPAAIAAGDKTGAAVGIEEKVVRQSNEVFERHIERMTGTNKVTMDYTAVTKEANEISVEQKEKLVAVLGSLNQLGGGLTKTERETTTNVLKAGDYKGALDNLRDELERVSSRHADQSDKLRGSQNEFKTAKNVAERYRGSLNDIPRGKDTNVKINTRDATDKITDYIELLKTIPGQISSTTTMKAGKGLPLKAIAPGGKAGSAAAMATAAMSAVPGSQVITSGYRPGDDGYHGDASNPAQDISGAQNNGVFIYGQNIYNHLLSTFGRNIREMIWAHDRWEDGQHNYWAASDHFDHVHVADRGGVFRGPGLVRLGDTKETIFEPAEKMSELSKQETTNNKKMEVHFHGDHPKPADVVREIDWYARTRPW